MCLCSILIGCLQVLVSELLESVFSEGVPSTPSARAAMNAHAAAAAEIHGS
jgi:hypothetical protein